MKKWNQPNIKELDVSNTNTGSVHNGFCVPDISSTKGRGRDKDKDKDKDKGGRGKRSHR